MMTRAALTPRRRLARSCLCLTATMTLVLIAESAAGQIPRSTKINSASLPLVDVTGEAVARDDRFGHSVTSIGDLDEDGVPDLAVGAPGAYGARGAVWILFMRRDGSVKSARVISEGRGGFEGMISTFDGFGSGVASLGDLSGNGSVELAVGADGDDTVSRNGGAVWVLSLAPDGTVNNASRLVGRASAPAGARSGEWLAAIGDIDKNGTVDLAVNGGCVPQNSTFTCSAWTWLLSETGAIIRDSHIPRPYLGSIVSMAPATDVDRDGVPDLLIGISRRDRGGEVGGPKIDLALLSADGTTKSVIRLKSEHPRYSPPDDNTGPAVDPPPIKPDSAFIPTGLAVLNDLNGDGWPEIAVGSHMGGGTVFFDPPPQPIVGTLTTLFPNLENLRSVERGLEHSTTAQYRPGAGPIGLDHDEKDRFGASVANIGDLDGDGRDDLAIGADRDNEIETDQGAVWIIMNLSAPAPTFSTIISTGGKQPTIGRTVRVSALIEDSASEPSGGNVLFRRSGDESFFSLDMEDVSVEEYCGPGTSTPRQPENLGCWSAEIPAFAVSDRGIDYFVTMAVKDGQNGRDPETGFHSLRIYVPNGLTTRTSSGTTSDGYRLVSFPLDLDEKKALSVLEDDLGAFDRRRWRFFQHSASTAQPDDGVPDTGLLTEVDQRPIDIVPGAAYWLLVREEGLVVNTGPGWSLPTDRPFEVSLGYGWNLVSNPFNFDIPVSQVSTSGGPHVQSLMADGLIDIVEYDGDWSESGDTLESSTGYALFVGDCLHEAICTPGVSGILRFYSDASSVPVSEAKRIEGRSDVWAIGVEARQARSRDLDNRAGVATEAQPGWDRMDRPEPPIIGDFVSVHFEHQSVGLARRLRHDYRPPLVDGAMWNINVESRTNEPVKLNFVGIESVPDGFNVWLIDDAARAWHELRADPTYVVSGPGEGKTRRLRLVVGTEDFIARDLNEARPLPAQFGLTDAYPNPFRDATTIRFGLVERSQIELQIYDILGRRVRSIVAGLEMEPGYHTIVWDSRDHAGSAVASGLYLVRLEAEGRVDTGSVSLIR